MSFGQKTFFTSSGGSNNVYVLNLSYVFIFVPCGLDDLNVSDFVTFGANLAQLRHKSDSPAGRTYVVLQQGC